MSDNFAYEHSLPCLNPGCKSNGKPHPNCRCYSGGEGPKISASQEEHYFGFAKGGQVCAQNMKHHPDCIYYSEGGEVHEHHSAVQHGLLGLLKDVGHGKLADPNKHIKDLDKIKGHLSEGDPGKAARIFNDHALAGASSKKNSNQILGQLSGAIVSNQSNPDGLKSASEYLSNIKRGHDKVDEHMNSMLGAKSNMNIKPDSASSMALGNHLQDLQAEPSKLLDIGGSLGHYLPDQATRLGALATTAIQYFDTIKPKPIQNAPLDTVPRVDKMAQGKYDRQLEIAQQPSLALQHVKNGTLQPNDIVTLKTLYPGLYESMVQKAGQALIKAKNDNVEIPYKQKRSLSLLLGQPLDSTMTTSAMQAIIKSQGPQQINNQAKAQKKPPSDTEFAQINKVDKMSLTPLEARQVNRKD